MRLQMPASPWTSFPWNAAREYFVPPLVIPVAVAVMVVLFVLIHGPVV